MFQARRLLAMPLAAGLVLAGCSNAGPAGSGISNLVPAASWGTAARERTTTTLSVHIPKRVRGSGRRHSHFVSPSTQSATILLAPNAGCTACTPALTLKIGLLAGSKHCAANATGVTCTIVFVLKPGSYTGSMTTYDGALDTSGNPTGSVLSEAQSFPLTVVSGKANAPAISLYGVPASFACVPVTGATLAIEGVGIVCNQAIFQVAAGFTSRFAVYAIDVDGNIMLGPGAPAFSASASGFTFATKGNVISVMPPTIDANLEALTINATSPACQLAGAVCSVNVAVAFDSLVAIADPSNNAVVLFSRLQVQAGAGPPYATITGVSAPSALAFDANGDLFIAGGSSQATSVVKEYAPPYTGAAVATMKTNLNQPYAMAMGHNGSLGVLNGGTTTAEVFVPPYTAAPKEAPLMASDATALAFDQNENLWVSFFSNSVERFPLAFSYGAIDTLLNASNGISHPTALQVDTTGDLFVGDGKVDEFPSPYNGMPAKSSNAVANITSMQLDGVHGFIAACGNTEVGFFHTSDLDESYLAATPAQCSLAFDRFHNLEAVYGGASSATTFLFDSSFVTWTHERTFTSTELNAPTAVATWP